MRVFWRSETIGYGATIGRLFFSRNVAQLPPFFLPKNGATFHALLMAAFYDPYDIDLATNLAFSRHFHCVCATFHAESKSSSLTHSSRQCEKVI